MDNHKFHIFIESIRNSLETYSPDHLDYFDKELESLSYIKIEKHPILIRQKLKKIAKNIVKEKENLSKEDVLKILENWIRNFRGVGSSKKNIEHLYNNSNIENKSCLIKINSYLYSLRYDSIFVKQEDNQVVLDNLPSNEFIIQLCSIGHNIIICSRMENKYT